MIKSVNPHAGLGKFSFTPPVKQSVNPHAGFSVLRNTPRASVTPVSPAPYNIDMLRQGTSGARDVNNAATYGINPDIIAGSGKSQWEMDDDTRDFLTDAFNTLNDPGYEEALGGGGSGGGGGGGGGPGFAGGPGSQHSTTWSFGNRPAFVPKGLL